MRLIVAIAALGLAAAPVLAQGVEAESALPVLKNDQCYDNAAATEPAQDQTKCRESLGQQGNQPGETTGTTTPPAPNPNPQ